MPQRLCPHLKIDEKLHNHGDFVYENCLILQNRNRYQILELSKIRFVLIADKLRNASFHLGVAQAGDGSIATAAAAAAVVMATAVAIHHIRTHLLSLKKSNRKRNSFFYRLALHALIKIIFIKNFFIFKQTKQFCGRKNRTFEILINKLRNKVHGTPVVNARYEKYARNSETFFTFHSVPGPPLAVLGCWNFSTGKKAPVAGNFSQLINGRLFFFCLLGEPFYFNWKA